MKSVLSVLKKPSKTIALCAFIAGILFSFIARAASIGTGFMPVIGDIILMLFDVAVFGVVPLLFILKKEDLAKTFFKFVFAYWLISRTYTLIGDASNIVKGLGGVWIAASVFDFLWGLALLSFIVLNVISFFKQDKRLSSAGLCILIGSLFLSVLAWILHVSAYATAKIGWQSYFNVVSYYLAIPTAISFTMLYFSSVEAKTLVVSTADVIATSETSSEEVAAETSDDNAEESGQ